MRAWSLIFDYQQAQLLHERGIFYVAWLLLNPPDRPLHALELIAKIPEFYRRQTSLPRLADPVTGQAVAPNTFTRLQEIGLAIEDARTLRAIQRLEQKLEAILDSESETEPIKQEALRDLEAIAQYKQQHGRRSKDNANRAAAAVRKAIKRFHARLAWALDFDGRPHPVLRPFAEHLEQYLLHPRARCPGGCFTYEPPPGVVWGSQGCGMTLTFEEGRGRAMGAVVGYTIGNRRAGGGRAM